MRQVSKLEASDAVKRARETTDGVARKLAQKVQLTPKIPNHYNWWRFEVINNAKKNVSTPKTTAHARPRIQV